LDAAIIGKNIEKGILNAAGEDFIRAFESRIASVKYNSSLFGVMKQYATGMRQNYDALRKGLSL